MRDIRIYDFEFNLLCVMTDVISSRWHLLYNGVGTYEGHFRIEDDISDIILKNRYIVVTQGDLQAICTGKIAAGDLTVCGRSVNWILRNRVRPPFKARLIFGEEYTDPETILLYCLEKGFTKPLKIGDDGTEIADSVDEVKAVKNFVLPNPIGAEKLTYHFWRITANDLSEITIDLCKKMNRGHRVVFDIENKCWRFEFIYPEKKNIILSKALNSVYDVTYSEDMQKQACGGWYLAVTDDETDENDNMWYYIGGAEQSGIYAWDCVLDCSGESEARDALSKRNITSSTNAKIRELEFGKDYFLGDVVTVHVKFGKNEMQAECMINGVDIQMTRQSSYQEPDLVIVNNEE